MRMSGWSDEIVRFMEDAASQSGYFRALACETVGRLPKGSFVCDAGCGMGHLAVEVARMGHRVIALDKSPSAASFAKELVDREKLRGRVTVFETDYRDAQNEKPYDCMVFCLSASVSDAFAAAAKVRAKSLVVVNKVHPRVEYRGEHLLDRPIVTDIAREYHDLKAQGIVCRVREKELEFGQPFRSADDARRYFELFRTRKYPLGVTDSELAKELVETGREEFPWYLPVTRKLSVFDVDMARSVENMRLGRFGVVSFDGASRRIA